MKLCCHNQEGSCSLGLFGGRPFASSCRICPQHSERVQPRWLGVRWFGVPFIRRIRVRARFPFVRIQPSSGCGCMVAPKAVFTRLLAFVRAAFSRGKVTAHGN